MFRLSLFASLAICAIAAPMVSAQETPLPNDPRILSGRLENGVAWVIRQHDNPPGKMALMMHVDTGSLNETEAQRGLAHFIEHMAFNGTEHFPPGTLIKYFESIGMEFGADLNAFTSFDQTSYMVFLPDTKEEDLDGALKVLSDYAFRASFLDQEIDKERGVVLSEMRAGKSAQQRIRDKLWPKLFEGTRFADRIPIGLEDVLEHAQRDEFLDYYNTWYRPERVAVILVGDADPDSIKPLVEKWFGQAKAAAPSREELGAQFKSFTEQRAFVMTDPEMKSCSVEMTNVLPARPPTTTVSQYRRDLVERLGSWIIARRFRQLVQKGEASFLRANASVDDFFHDATLVEGQARGEPQNWDKMLEQLIVEVSRACEHGFTPHELELARTEYLADAQRDVETDSTRNARAILFEILRAVNDNEPVIAPKDRLELMKSLLPEIRLSEVNQAFKNNFSGNTFAYVVEMPEKEGVSVPASETVLAAARAALAKKTEPLGDEEGEATLIAKAPEPGKVTGTTKDDDLGITTLTFDNGVVMHHREMDYKKDTVYVSISLAGGPIEETAANAGISQAAALGFNDAATSKLSATQIDDLMTGKNIRVRAFPIEDAMQITISGSTKDLEDGLKLAYAVLTDGVIEESAFNHWQQSMTQRIRMMQTRPEYYAFVAAAELTSGNDPRVVPMTLEELDALTRSGAQEWLTRLCRTAPIEVAVVGDISLDDAKALVAKYVGSLPSRSKSAERLDALRELHPGPGPWEKRIDVDTMTPRAMVLAGFPVCDGDNVEHVRALSLATNILSSRLIERIREDLGLVYSIRASQQTSFGMKHASMLGSGAPCDPSKVEEVLSEVEKTFQEFAKNGPTAEELENAKKQILNNIDETEKEPSYWLSLLSHLNLHKRSLDEQKHKKEAYEAFTVEQVRDIYDQYCKPDRMMRVAAVPTHPESSTPEPTAEPSEEPKPAPTGASSSGQ